MQEANLLPLRAASSWVYSLSLLIRRGFCWYAWNIYIWEKLAISPISWEWIRLMMLAAPSKASWLSTEGTDISFRYCFLYLFSVTCDACVSTELIEANAAEEGELAPNVWQWFLALSFWDLFFLSLLEIVAHFLAAILGTLLFLRAPAAAPSCKEDELWIWSSSEKEFSKEESWQSFSNEFSSKEEEQSLQLLWSSESSSMWETPADSELILLLLRESWC